MIMSVQRAGADDARRSSLISVAPLVPFIIVGLVASRAIRDNSFIWHIRAGEAQLDAGLVLTQDVFSFTRLGEAWRTQSWLLELGYSLAESTFGGLAWGNWMVLIVGSSALALVGLAVYRSIPSMIMTSLAMVLGVLLLGPFLQPRPVIFSFLFLALIVVALGDAQKLGWTLIPIVWVWSAVHGSWVLGVGLIALEAVRTKDRRLFAIAALSLVATLVTAHGMGTWLIVLDFFESREALSMMQEWMPPAPQDIVQLPYLLLVAGVVIAGIREKITVRDLIVILPFLLFGLTSRRAIVPATIVLLPWAVKCLPVPRASSATVSSGLVRGAGIAIGLTALFPMAIGAVGVLEEQRFPSPRIVESLETGKWFHSMATGGYLIYADWPHQLVHIDDRAELYGAEAIARYHATIAGSYIDEFATWDIEGVIAEHDWPLIEVLVDDGWQVQAEDEHFVSLSSH
jgi:hypothetical protein